MTRNMNTTRSQYVRGAARLFRVVRGLGLWQPAQVRCDKLWMGSQTAQWCIFPDAISSFSIIYSFGVGKMTDAELNELENIACPGAGAGVSAARPVD
jgi:hypothetical protein